MPEYPDLDLLQRVLSIVQQEFNPVKDSVNGMGGAINALSVHVASLIDFQKADPTRAKIVEELKELMAAHEKGCAVLHEKYDEKDCDRVEKYAGDVAAIKKMATWIIMASGIIGLLAVPVITLLYQHHSAIMKLIETVEKLPK